MFTLGIVPGTVRTALSTTTPCVWNSTTRRYDCATPGDVVAIDHALPPTQSQSSAWNQPVPQLKVAVQRTSLPGWLVGVAGIVGLGVMIALVVNKPSARG